MKRRRDTTRGTVSRNVDASAGDRQTTVAGAADRRRADHNDVDRRRRHRHHSVNEALTQLDVRVPLRVGQDAARPVQCSVAGPSTSSSGNVQDVSREKLLPVAVVVEGRAAGADQPDRDRRPAPPARLVDLLARKTAAARGSALVDLRRLGRRCRSLDNIHAFASADEHRTYALLMIGN